MRVMQPSSQRPLHRPPGIRFAHQDGLYDHMPAQFILANGTTSQGQARMGTLLDMIDIAGGLVASRFVKGRPIVTRSLDRMMFGEPAKKFEYLTTQANITYTGGRTMEVAITLDAHNYKSLQYRKHTVAQGYLTYTLFDKNTKMIPEITPFQSKAELDQYIGGEIRRQNRFKERHALDTLGPPEAFYIQDHEHPWQTEYQTSDKDANVHGIVFGGTILDLIYRAGEQAAATWAKTPVKTLRQDRMQFDKPGKIGNILTTKALVSRVFDNRQIEVQVELYSRKPRQRSWQDWFTFWKTPASPVYPPIATSFFLFEPQDTAIQLPDVTPKSDLQKRRWQAADIRRQFREADAQTKVNPN